jgi:hypothetical protein
LVGAAGLIFTSDGHWQVLSGANSTEFKGDDKDCAEMNVWEQAREIDGRIFAMAISGPPQIRRCDLDN